MTSEEREELRERILNFNNWVDCGCSECRHDARAHAVNTYASLEALANEVLGPVPTPEPTSAPKVQECLEPFPLDQWDGKT